jgi:adenylyltransferase/sulfurtransferase
VKIITYTTLFDNTNAVSIMNDYDLVLDCTDNPSTRYLISDSSRALGIPLISGAAMRYDGQLCTYNHGDSGPCYRCVFPTPPKSENVGTCEDEGVLGVVTGVVGTLQAMEAIKLLTELNNGKCSDLFYRWTLQLHSAPHRSQSNAIHVVILCTFGLAVPDSKAEV